MENLSFCVFIFNLLQTKLPEKELGEVVESLATGAAGGWTAGWTSEMIVDIMSDDVCRR